MSSRERLAHLVSHPIPYFAPLYRELAARPEVELTVYFYTDVTLREYHDAEFGRSIRWDTELVDGYRCKIFPSAHAADLSRRVRRCNWDICRDLVAERYDAVWVHGYGYPTAWAAAVAARASGAAFLIREEQTLLHGRPLFKRLAKQALLRTLFRRATGLYIGEQNRRYLRHYGLREDRLFPARYCVDNALYQEAAAGLRTSRHGIRRDLGITDDAPIILFCGKLIPKKQPLLLLEAYRRVRREHPCWLVMAGDGPLRRDAETMVDRLGIAGVRMPGFVNQISLPAVYSVADLLVLPSALHETWGLVVNEAMNFALPIVVSDKVGCADDLVRHGWNGFVVGHRRVDDLAGAISTMVADADLRRLFGERSRRLINNYSVRSCADGIVVACLASIHRRSSHAKEVRVR
jgi:glycosyltransferase involved in cell wall biosynthesis